MFHLSSLITRLISTLYKLIWSTCSVLAFSVFVISFSYASQPDWVLSGTFLDEENAHAMFVDKNGDQLLLELGEGIQGCELLGVLQSSAKLQCKDKEYVLYLRSSVGDILLQAEHEKSLENREIIVLSKSDVTDYVNNKQRLVSEIGFLPLIEDEQVIGFTLSKIQPDTKASSLGLYNGDVIKTVNDVSASDPDFLQTVQELSDVSEVTIQVERNGQLMAYTYTIE